MITYSQLTETWSPRLFWIVLTGACLAQIATNASNDYFDHTSNADEMNKVASPFNGGSRVIQVGLMTAGQVLLTAMVAILGTITIGLYLNKEISPTEALLGTTVEVPTLKEPKMVKIPPCTQSHIRLRLKGMGIASNRNKTQGDQFVRVIVKYPKELTEEQLQLIYKLKATGL